MLVGLGIYGQPNKQEVIKVFLDLKDCGRLSFIFHLLNCCGGKCFCLCEQSNRYPSKRRSLVGFDEVC